jgi:hypothetical protein
LIKEGNYLIYQDWKLGRNVQLIRDKMSWTQKAMILALRKKKEETDWEKLKKEHGKKDIENAET